MLTAEVLRQYTPLHNLTDANLARLARRLHVEDLAKGAVLCREGDTGNDGGEHDQRGQDRLACHSKRSPYLA